MPFNIGSKSCCVCIHTKQAHFLLQTLYYIHFISPNRGSEKKTKIHTHTHAHIQIYCFFLLAFFILFVIPLFRQNLHSRLIRGPQTQARSTWNLNTICFPTFSEIWLTVKKIIALRNFRPTPRLWKTSSRSAANAVTASFYLSDRSDANALIH